MRESTDVEGVELELAKLLDVSVLINPSSRPKFKAIFSPDLRVSSDRPITTDSQDSRCS
jgi:hypothetical protein